MFVDEYPLFLGEYEQAFKSASLITDFGYTKGYKRIVIKKRKVTTLIFLQNLRKI